VQPASQGSAFSAAPAPGILLPVAGFLPALVCLLHLCLLDTVSSPLLQRASPRPPRFLLSRVLPLDEDSARHGCLTLSFLPLCCPASLSSPNTWLHSGDQTSVPVPPGWPSMCWGVRGPRESPRGGGPRRRRCRCGRAVREAPAAYPSASLASASAEICPGESSSLCAMEGATGREAREGGLAPSQPPFCWVSLAKSLSLSGPRFSYLYSQCPSSCDHL